MSPVRNPLAIALALLLGATAQTAAQEGDAHIQALQESLIAYSASDFAASRSRPERFRKVYLRYRENDDGARSHMLCGQVRMGIGDKADWVDFATIKTDPYEQWIGGSATDMCARAIPASPNGDDLSILLQTKLGLGAHADGPEGDTR